MDRNETIREIREALKRRSGKAWSVTARRAAGWITICAPPARLTMHAVLRPGAVTTWPEDYMSVDTGIPGGYMTPADCAELAMLLCLDRVHDQGELIPASNAHYTEYIDRANGREPSRRGEQYWD